MARTLVIFLLLGNISLCAYAQNQVKLDSLTLELVNTKVDTTRMQLLLDISKYYSTHDYNNAAQFAQRAIDLAKEKNNISFEQKGERALGAIFFHMSNYKLASTHFYNALKFYENQNDSLGIFSILNNLGAVHDRLLDYDQALTYYLKAQTLLTKIKMDPKVKNNYLTLIYNNIANIYQTKSNFQSAHGGSFPKTRKRDRFHGRPDGGLSSIMAYRKKPRQL